MVGKMTTTATAQHHQQLPAIYDVFVAQSGAILNTISVSRIFPQIWRLHPLLPRFVAAVLQAYETRVGDVFVVSGNDALMACSLPSHTAQLLQLAAWVTSEGAEIIPRADPSWTGQ
jgi:hypothetical protein